MPSHLPKGFSRPFLKIFHILEAVLLEVMYKLPSEEEVSKVIIDENVINGTSEPMLIYENVEQPRAAPEE